ncbi:hypothetical protein [Thermus caldilimi]|uniref:hypothetical protein n=1 Tax=Thermus caldilimi TaxID=2483360 RepID=UPI0010766D32|nr:hypothetical protein [Thermus caldilimi]
MRKPELPPGDPHVIDVEWREIEERPRKGFHQAVREWALTVLVVAGAIAGFWLAMGILAYLLGF